MFLELKKVGTKKVLISGGEPLIRSDFQGIIESIKSNGMEIAIVTNGTLMNNKIADVLEKASAETIFSLDGSKAGIHDLARAPRMWFARAFGESSALRPKTVFHRLHAHLADVTFP